MSYTAKDSFWADGKIVHRGDVLAEDDSVVKGREHLFDHEPPEEKPKTTHRQHHTAHKPEEKDEK